MNEPFDQLVATLHKVQGTMGPQLVRLGQAQHLDRVRLPCLQREAKQLKDAAAALLGRMMRNEAATDLIRQTIALVEFFDEAERQAAALVRTQSKAGPEVTYNREDDAPNEADSDRDSVEPSRSARVGSRRLRPAPSSKSRGARGGVQSVRSRASGDR